MKIKNIRLLPQTVLAAAAFSVISTPALAELKTDGLWRATGGAALSQSSGNTEATSVAITLDAVNATTSDKTTLGGAYNYGRSKAAGISTTNTEKWNLFGQYDYNLGPRMYGFGRLDGQGDKLADLDLRLGLSAGLGYKLIDNANTTFNLFGGAGYTTDRYGAAQMIDGRTNTRFSRSSLILGEESTHKISASTDFKQRLEYAAGLSGDKANLTKFTAGLQVAMSRTLSLAVGFTANHNSAPPAGQKSTDTLLFTGINVKLGAD